MFVIYCLPTGIHAQQTALKTNTLFWATTTPNVGVEFGITRQITLDLWGAYNAWKFSNDMKLNMYLFQPEVRYWFCRKFEGHFIGVHGHWGHFNIGQIPFIRPYIAGRSLWWWRYIWLPLGIGRTLGTGSDDRCRICLYEIRQIPLCRLRWTGRELHAQLHRS